MQVCCMHGPTLAVAACRVILPLLFFTHVSNSCFILDLNGGERICIAYVLASFKTQEYLRPKYLFSMSVAIFVAFGFGSLLWVQWCLFISCLLTIHDHGHVEMAKKVASR